MRVLGIGAQGFGLDDWLLIQNLGRESITKDTDGNGLEDLLEFLFNLDPWDPQSRGNLPRIERRGADLLMRFSRMKTVIKSPEILGFLLVPQAA